MTSDYVTRHVVPVLAATPGVLRALLRDQPPERVRAAPQARGWSAHQVVAHLVHGERTDWVPRARIILSGAGDRSFEPFVREPAESGEGTEPLLRLFEQLRRENLAFLASATLGPRELALTGTHPEFGEVTLRQLLAAWAAHDLGHVRQICRVLAQTYAADVGPRAAYLPVVRETGGAS